MNDVIESKSCGVGLQVMCSWTQFALCAANHYAHPVGYPTWM